MASSRDILIQYTRTGGRLPPRDRERLVIYRDGSFEMWRSIGAASQPPSPVGRFQGVVPAELFSALMAQVAAAEASGDLSVTPPPDASIDHIQLGKAQARMGLHDQPAGPWGFLAEALRQALGRLTDQPLAALGLQVSSTGDSAWLFHLGTQNLKVILRNLQVRAVLWNQHRKEGDWRQNVNGPDAVDAQPGWSFQLPFEHGFEAAPGFVVAAYVTAALLDGDQLVPVSLEARSQPA